jgi:hypothetical protein
VLDSSGQIRNTYGYTAGLLPSLDGWELYQEPVELFDGFEAYRRCFAGENMRRKSWQSNIWIGLGPGDCIMWKKLDLYGLSKKDAEATDWMVVK